MEKQRFDNYQAPQLEVLEVEIESGFATSGEGNPNDYGWGGGI